MSHTEYDLLVIGATGYTGRLVTEYLANHPNAPALRIAIGGRSLPKVQELAHKHKNISAVYVDLSDEDSVQRAIAKTRVVINIAGPYWTRGSVVVKACARNGVHYVDLTGEAPWIAQIIQDYDYLAFKNHACIVTCTGYDSIPSDLAAYLAVQTLEKQLSIAGVSKPVHITSTAAHSAKGGMSGGTAATIMNAFEGIPTHKRRNGRGWGLSPISGPAGFSALPGILYSLPRVQPTVYGGFFLMSGINEPIVRRSWGLRERYRRETQGRVTGSTFSYTEFLATNGRIQGILLSLTIFVAAAAMALLPPVRWLAKMVLPKSGEGPAPDDLDKGCFKVTNITEADGVAVKSYVQGKGDPGYRLSSMMTAESALLLLDPSNLTPLGQQGGILTPSAAFGNSLARALESTGRFGTSTEVLESEKTR